MRRVAKCAPTWANQTSGSDGQNGGSFTTETFVTAVVATAVGSSSAIEVGGRRDHECKAMRVGFTGVRR